MSEIEQAVDGGSSFDQGASAPDTVVLIGMPGAGKSTLGVVLAKILNRRFVDCDLEIQGRMGATLQQLIDERGVEGFLKIEEGVLSDLQARGAIVATGGSAVYSEAAMRHLAGLGPVVYLEISYESLLDRLGDLDERGVVMKGGASMSLRDLYDERRPLYERAADVVVNIDGLNITEAARKVAASLPLAVGRQDAPGALGVS